MSDDNGPARGDGKADEPQLSPLAAFATDGLIGLLNVLGGGSPVEAPPGGGRGRRS
jgi:hypothetical protein